MKELVLAIRPATDNDIEEIWHLLHADYKLWCYQEIRKNLTNLWVLVVNQKIIGVLYAKKPEKNIEWVTIHPFYPEEKWQEFMIFGLKAFSKYFSI